MTIDQFIQRVEDDFREQGDNDAAWTEVQTKYLLPVVEQLRRIRAENERLTHELSVANNWADHHAKHADDLIGENVRLRAEIKSGWSEPNLDTENALLRAENARLSKALNTVQDERAASFARLGKAVGGVSVTEYQPEVDIEIEAVIKELRKDQGRLDWLGSALGRLWQSTFPEATVDRVAIDAAMKEYRK